ADVGRTGRIGVLHRTFTLPRSAGVVFFRAAAIRPEGCKSTARLEVILEGTERRLAPRSLRTDRGLVAAPTLLTPLDGQWREYVWHVDQLAGQTVRIALFDEDDRPGCHVVCGGFRVMTRNEFNDREFAEHMRRLARDHKLQGLARFESKRFLAMGN